MSYISNYMPESLQENMFRDGGREFGEEANMPNRFEKTKDGKLIRIGTGRPVQNIQFRDSSIIQTNKKPCGCMGNKN